MYAGYFIFASLLPVLMAALCSEHKVFTYNIDFSLQCDRLFV